MTGFAEVVLAYFIILFIIQIILIVLLLTDKKDKVQFISGKPFVSILVAVRNEEDNILACLQSLDKLDWSKSNYEVLIGDDLSEDGTAGLIKAFIRDKGHFHLYTIIENWGAAKGKANVLAQLSRKAKGDVFCITDADIRVPSCWLNGLVGTWSSYYGTISGVTMVKGNSIFARFQQIDWLNAFGMIRVVTNKNIPVTAVGNNMLISKEAYLSTGGYERIPFSVTEDFELFRQTLKQGWKYKNLLIPEALALTEPVKSLSQFLQQRKRWMTGALKLPLLMIFILAVQSLFFLFLIAAFYFLSNAWILWGIKIVLSMIFIGIVQFKLRVFKSFINILPFELLSPALGILQIIYFNLPGKIKWKGREFYKR